MAKNFKIASLVFVILTFLLLHAQAVTRDEIIEVCKKAAKMVETQGINAAIKAIQDPNGPFVWNNSVNYVFLMNMKGKMLAHPFKPELLKPDSLLSYADSDGKLFFVDLVRAAKKGAGWIHYMWPLPNETKPIKKYTFVYRVPNTDYFVGCGMYILRPGEYY